MHNTGMDIFYVRAAILIISIGSIVWGGMISFSERFFAYWQNTHWKESNSSQWADEAYPVDSGSSICSGAGGSAPLRELSRFMMSQ